MSTKFAVFVMLKTLNKSSFFSPANSSLVVILITIGDVTDIFAIATAGLFLGSTCSILQTVLLLINQDVHQIL